MEFSSRWTTWQFCEGKKLKRLSPFEGNIHKLQRTLIFIEYSYSVANIFLLLSCKLAVLDFFIGHWYAVLHRPWVRYRMPGASVCFADFVSRVLVCNLIVVPLFKKFSDGIEVHYSVHRSVLSIPAQSRLIPFRTFIVVNILNDFWSRVRRGQRITFAPRA
jgi:hypothetical protein